MNSVRGKGEGGRGKKKPLRVLVYLAAFFLLPTFPFPLAPSPYAAQDPRPLPDAEKFYGRVRENLARAERLNHLYAYKERRTDVHTNPFGQLGTGGTSLFDVYPSAIRQLTYRRLVARHEMPVSTAELAEQDGQYRVRVAEVRRQMPGGAADERRRLEEEDARSRARGQRSIDDVVNTLEFSLERRTTYNGVPAIIVTFKPKPTARPTTRQGRIAQKFAGTVWIAEETAEVMHLEAKSTDDISFGLGLVARLSEGTTATLTRRSVGGGLWMPTTLTLTGRGRAALFLRRLAVDFAIEWFDYRRLPDDSLTPFLDPRVQGQAGSSP